MNRTAIMTRAWAIFRETYRYPAIPFRSIGRPCFGWALSEAWRESREATRRAAIPTEVKIARADTLRGELSMLTYRDDYRRAEMRRRKIKTVLMQLAA